MNARFAPAYSYWLPLVILGALVLLTLWLERLSDSGSLLAGAGFGHDPDYFVEGFHATAYSDDGTPHYRLTAEKMVHFMDDDSTTLTQPHFTRLDPNLSRVEVTAQRGLVSSAGENVYFIDEVRMVQTTPDAQLPVELQAEYLRIIPDANLLRTEKPVTLIQGNSTVTAGSMEADGAKRTLVLSGGVKGTYASRH